ncbi:glycosyltransferase family 87 protein [Lolliginicoccus suaedae]|uniref:glycosyltransferase family 87 protein n=1 Tax=Lolliginicoccus suaedae TaxID=2605429 RepID=UPI0011F05B68
MPDAAGARPAAAPGLGPEQRDLPTLAHPAVAQLSTAIGGPVGQHAQIGSARFWTPLRVVLALAVLVLALAWTGKAACIQQYPGGPDGTQVLDWRDSRQYVALCYSDTVPLYGAHRLNELALPYKTSWEQENADGTVVTRYMEYPVVTGMYQYAAAVVASVWAEGAREGWLPGALPVVLYFNVVALGLAVAWLLTVRCTMALAGRRPWDAALVALSPIALVHVFTNFDAIATALTLLALLAWSRGRSATSGLLIGLGAAAKLYPVFLVGALLVLCLRTGRLGSWARMLVAAIAAWLAVNLPVRVLYPQGWLEFFRLNNERGMDPDSIYNVVRSFTGWPGFDGVLAAGESPRILNAVSLGAFLLVCIAVAIIALTAPRRPRVTQLMLLLVVGFLITNKVWSPQFSLWLVPLAVLAVPRYRLLLAWMVIDALVWVPRMYYYLGTGSNGLPEQWFTATVVLRDIAILVVCAVVVRDIYRPGEDRARQHGRDDPAGGPLDHAPDAPPRWLPRWLRPRGFQPWQATRNGDAGEPVAGARGLRA